MSSDWNTLDRQAPIPYVRDKAKKAFEVPTVKFQFEREQTKPVTVPRKLKLIMEFQLVL